MMMDKVVHEVVCMICWFSLLCPSCYMTLIKVTEMHTTTVPMSHMYR